MGQPIQAAPLHNEEPHHDLPIDADLMHVAEAKIRLVDQHDRPQQEATGAGPRQRRPGQHGETLGEVGSLRFRRTTSPFPQLNSIAGLELTVPQRGAKAQNINAALTVCPVPAASGMLSSRHVGKTSTRKPT